MQLRDYQQRAIDGLYGYFEVAGGNPLIIAPTGSGKSVIIGALCQDIITRWPFQRLMVLSHVKELLEQNFSKIKGFWPEAPAGLYSAGLRSKETRQSIIVAGIQSVHKKPHVFGWRDLVLIDECHLLSPDSDTMYRRFIDGLKQTNPALKVVGLTATAYRLKTGRLTEGPNRLFTDVAVEISLQELLDAGHICPLISKSSVIQGDLSEVSEVAGELNSREQEVAMDKEELTRAALDEVFSLAADRKSWLIFVAGKKHGNHVEAAIRSRGLTAKFVHSDTPPEERDAAHADFKTGRLRVLISLGIHTTGFDAPNIDLIVMLRKTLSPGLYYQILGRGMRLFQGKLNCLVLDYAGNIEYHGPITDLKPPRASVARGARGERHTPICLICPICRMASPLGAMECADCGHTFKQPERINHETEASMAEVMRIGPAPSEIGDWMAVESIRYARHIKLGKPPSLRVEYSCGLRRVSEWVCLEHPPGFALAKAIKWWKARAGEPVPESVEDALARVETLRKPGRILARQNGKYMEVLNYDFDEDRPASATPAA